MGHRVIATTVTAVASAGRQWFGGVLNRPSTAILDGVLREVGHACGADRSEDLRGPRPPRCVPVSTTFVRTRPPRRWPRWASAGRALCTCSGMRSLASFRSCGLPSLSAVHERVSPAVPGPCRPASSPMTPSRVEGASDPHSSPAVSENAETGETHPILVGEADGFAGFPAGHLGLAPAHGEAMSAWSQRRMKRRSRGSITNPSSGARLGGRSYPVDEAR